MKTSLLLALALHSLGFASALRLDGRELGAARLGRREVSFAAAASFATLLGSAPALAAQENKPEDSATPSSGPPPGAKRVENLVAATPEEEKELKAAAAQLDFGSPPPGSDLAKFLADDSKGSVTDPRAHGN